MKKIYSNSISKLIEKLDKKTLLLFVLNIIWMGIIFYFSSQPGDESSQLSGAVTVFLLRLLDVIFLGKIPQGIKNLIGAGHIVRKAGHAAEYFILGVLVNLLLKRLTIKKSTAVAAVICLLYAISDEFHQIFVSGRGPSALDVLLDFISSVFAIIFVNLIGYMSARRKNIRKN